MPKKKEDEVLGGYQHPFSAPDDEPVVEEDALLAAGAAVAGDGEPGADGDGDLDRDVAESAGAVDSMAVPSGADELVLAGSGDDSDDSGSAGALADIGEAGLDLAEKASVKTWPSELEPKIGLGLHYVLDSGNNAGDCRPMVIVRVWPDNGLLQGVVFFDGTNDGRGVAEWVTSVRRDDEAQEHRTWHWSWSCPRDF